MMNIIKRSILIFVCFLLVFSCCPVFSYADYDSGIWVQEPIEYSTLRSNEWFSISVIDFYRKKGSGGVEGSTPSKQNRIFSYESNNALTADRCALVCKPSSGGNYGYQYYLFSSNRSGNLNYTYISDSGIYYKPYAYTAREGTVTYSYRYETVSLSTNIPMFVEDGSFELSRNTLNTSGDAYNWLVNGVLANSQNVIGYGYSGPIPIDPSELGFIKSSYYVNNALLTGPMTVSDSPETITWQNTSTTGYDLNQEGVQIRFMIKDRSVYQRNENAWGTGTLGTINNFITNVTGFLSSNLFPNGSWQKSWLRGDVTRSDTHEQFFGQKFSYPGSRGKASFNWLASYRDHPQIQISTYANDMLSTNKSFYESLYQNTLGDFTIPYISWDIYAQIIAPDGTEGNWLKIDKHGAPFQEQGNRLDGGVTDEPVKIHPSIPDNNTWNDGDETPIEDDDDDDDSLPVGYVDPGSGDTYNEYNNYTYNYDNRSWIENHYDNSTVESVNDGIDWIKLFPGFFGLFLKFFGAFLPSWAVACVTIGIPIILGLILFRLIKGVIPFV